MSEVKTKARGGGLSQLVIAQLKQLIYSGEIKPGERINEAALATRMELSRGPVREAIKVLAGLGLVTAVPNKGVYVRQISMREMLEIYEMRTLVFSYAAERACELLSDSHKQSLEQLLEAMDAACEAHDGATYYELNLKFHELILIVADNQRAKQAYEDYVKELHLVRRKYFNSPGNMRRSNIEHRAIYDAIVQANKAKARAAAGRHVQSGRERLLSTMVPE